MPLLLDQFEVRFSYQERSRRNRNRYRVRQSVALLGENPTSLTCLRDVLNNHVGRTFQSIFPWKNLLVNDPDT